MAGLPCRWRPRFQFDLFEVAVFQALAPQSLEQRSPEVSVAINDAHHAFEVFDPVDGDFDGFYPLRLKSISCSLAFESWGITRKYLSLFHLGLDRVPQLLHLILACPESEPDGVGSHHCFGGVAVVPSIVAFLVSFPTSHW